MKQVLKPGSVNDLPFKLWTSRDRFTLQIVRPEAFGGIPVSIMEVADVYGKEGVVELTITADGAKTKYFFDLAFAADNSNQLELVEADHGIGPELTKAIVGLPQGATLDAVMDTLTQREFAALYDTQNEKFKELVARRLATTTDILVHGAHAGNAMELFRKFNAAIKSYMNRFSRIAESAGEGYSIDFELKLLSPVKNIAKEYDADVAFIFENDFSVAEWHSNPAKGASDSAGEINKSERDRKSGAEA